MTALWWLALPVLLLPLWWHRQKREQGRAQPLATARFLPRSDPRQQRVWQWVDRFLLLARCLLLVCAIALLADLTLAWRGDSVLVGAGTEPVWAEQQIAAAGFQQARRIELDTPDAIGWLLRHEREWKADARLLLVGELPMPAMLPRFRHRVELRSKAKPFAADVHRIAIASQRAPEWRALFAALDAPERFVLTEWSETALPEVATSEAARNGGAASGTGPELIIWDIPGVPPAGLRAPLWWIGAATATAFPELRHGTAIDGMRYADSVRGRLWAAPDWPPVDADAARVLFERWQRLHFTPVAFPAPSQVIPVSALVAPVVTSGALRDFLIAALALLFALERGLAHARRR
jgi:hypothetical protein